MEPGSAEIQTDIQPTEKDPKENLHITPKIEAARDSSEAKTIATEIPEAIEVSVVLGQLEQGLFARRSDGTILPSEDWESKYEEIMKDHPNLSQHDAVFRISLARLEYKHDNINAFWNFIHKEHSEDVPPDGNYEANPELSEDVCHRLLGIDTAKTPKVEKGATILRIYLSGEDYATLIKNRSSQDTDPIRSSGGFFQSAVRYQNYGLPMIVINRDVGEATSNPNEVNNILTHEVNHFEYDFSSEVIGELSKDYWRDDIGSNNQQRLEKYYHDPHSAFGDEFLAYMTPLNWLENLESISEAQLEEFVEAHIEQFLRGKLVNRERWIEEVQSGQHVDLIKNAGKSYLDMLHFISENYPDLKPGSTANKLFMQFPVEKWPAVVRLLKMKNASAANNPTSSKLPNS